MPFKYRCFLVVSPLILVLDQWTKWLVYRHIPLHSSLSVIPGYVDVVHIMNTGAAFGLLAGSYGTWRSTFFFAIAIIVLGGIIFYVRHLPAGERLMAIILALVTGGILGNIIDRIRFGAVVDFLSVHWRHVVVDPHIGGWHWPLLLEWPAFNVADSAITVSMLLLCYKMIRK